jgi:hypothetical protein
MKARLFYFHPHNPTPSPRQAEILYIKFKSPHSFDKLRTASPPSLSGEKDRLEGIFVDSMQASFKCQEEKIHGVYRP